MPNGFMQHTGDKDKANSYNIVWLLTLGQVDSKAVGFLALFACQGEF